MVKNYKTPKIHRQSEKIHTQYLLTIVKSMQDLKNKFSNIRGKRKIKWYNTFNG